MDVSLRRWAASNDVPTSWRSPRCACQVTLRRSFFFLSETIPWTRSWVSWCGLDCFSWSGRKKIWLVECLVGISTLLQTLDYVKRLYIIIVNSWTLNFWLCFHKIFRLKILTEKLFKKYCLFQNSMWKFQFLNFFADEWDTNRLKPKNINKKLI